VPPVFAPRVAKSPLIQRRVVWLGGRYRRAFGRVPRVCAHACPFQGTAPSALGSHLMAGSPYSAQHRLPCSIAAALG
jgi:hypothetical protein